MSHTKLTGRTRHRIGFRNKCVLQHEVEGLVTSCIGGIVDSEWATWWIDSKPEWLTTEEKQQ